MGQPCCFTGFNPTGFKFEDISVEEVAVILCFCFRSQSTRAERSSLIRCFKAESEPGAVGVMET